MMGYINAFFGWMWRRRSFFLTTIVAALFFFAWLFPFSDLSDAVTTAIARGTGNQVYVQFNSLDIEILPIVAASASGVAADLATLPTLAVEYLKIRPAWFSMLFSPIKLFKAARGDMEAQTYAAVLALSHVRADGILGGDVSVDLSPASVTNGSVSLNTDLEIEELDLNQLQDWAELPVKLKGKASADISMKINPSMSEQPEGEFSLKVSKFSLPASTVMIPMGEGASMPMNLPTLTLANVVFRGRLVAGNLVLEEGTFGQASDPVHGRIKGQMDIRIQPVGPGQFVPILGNYNLTVDLSATKAIEKEIGIAFLLFESAKTPTSSGSRYIFRAQGQGMGGVPSITKLGSF